MLQQKNKGRARVRLAVFIVLSIHVFGLMALLMQGCRKTPEAEPAATERRKFRATIVSAVAPQTPLGESGVIRHGPLEHRRQQTPFWP